MSTNFTSEEINKALPLSEIGSHEIYLNRGKYLFPIAPTTEDDEEAKYAYGHSIRIDRGLYRNICGAYTFRLIGPFRYGYPIND